MDEQKPSKFSVYKIFLYYSVVLATIMMVGAFFQTQYKTILVADILFAPVVLFFYYLLVNKTKKPGTSVFSNIVLIYSAIFTAIITVGGFLNSHLAGEFSGNIVFLPLTLLCWALFLGRFKIIFKGISNFFFNSMAKAVEKRQQKDTLSQTQNSEQNNHKLI